MASWSILVSNCHPPVSLMQVIIPTLLRNNVSKYPCANGGTVFPASQESITGSFFFSSVTISCTQIASRDICARFQGWYKSLLDNLIEAHTCAAIEAGLTKRLSSDTSVHKWCSLTWGEGNGWGCTCCSATKHSGEAIRKLQGILGLYMATIRV